MRERESNQHELSAVCETSEKTTEMLDRNKMAYEMQVETSKDDDYC